MSPEKRTVGALAIGTTLLVPVPAFAMHVSEGILPVSWALLWFAIALPVVAHGLRELQRQRAADPQRLALVALVGAAVFVISCMPVPVLTAGTTAHPCGTGIAAVLIGPALTAVVASVALVLQALFLGHGGLTTLGANIVSMGVVGAYAGYFAFAVARRAGISWWGAAFAAGLVSDWATYAMTSFQLATALHGERALGTVFLGIVVAFVPTQVPLGILEGLLSGAAYRLVQRRRPDLLERLAGRPLS